MDREELHEQLLEDLSSRSMWEQYQRLWYQMRHEGPGRLNRPWPGAADMHYPLSDTQITKFKPFYQQQVFSMETVADFMPLRNDLKPYAVMASYWFDDKIREKTNLRKEIVVCADKMLMAGFCPMKVKWCSEKDQIVFEAIDPLNLIMPAYTKDIQEVDRLAHVMIMSVDAYKRNDNYNQDEAFIESIKGRKNDADRSRLDQTKLQREGFTYTAEKDQIVLWEVFTREKNDADEWEWIVDTYSPVNLEEDVRPKFTLPYNHGKVPFVIFPFEIKESEIYSSRGIPEIVKMAEAYLTKLMNEKADALTIANRPIYTASAAMPNTENLRLQPGSILPGDIKAIINPPPPISFDQEQANTLSIVEAQIGSPDFGITYDNQPGQESRTKYEVSQVVAFSQVIVGLRAEIFRDALNELFRQCWSLYLQYAKDDIDYNFKHEIAQIDEKALTDGYRIQPKASADGFNRQMLLSKALARLQMFGTSQFINQSELVKSALELDDPRLIQRLYQDPGIKAANQAEKQALEVTILEKGFQAPVDPSDDDKEHLDTLIGYIQAQVQRHQPITPLAFQTFFAHGVAHVNKLKTLDKSLGGQYEHQLKAIYDAMVPQTTGQTTGGQPLVHTPQMANGVH